YGAVVSYLRGPRIAGTPPFAILPGPIASTGVSVSHGQSAGFLGKEHEAVFPLGESGDPIVRLRGNFDPARENPDALVRTMDQAQCNLEENAEGSDTEGSLATVFSP